MITRKFHSALFAKSAMFLVLMFPVALTANQNQNTAPSTNSNASTNVRESQTDETKDDNLTVKPVLRKAVILERISPGYTKQARKNGTEGIVKLRVVLAAAGQVENIQVLEALPDGLTEKAIEAAKKLKFRPATKDGRPVSQYITIVFPFSLY